MKVKSCTAPGASINMLQNEVLLRGDISEVFVGPSDTGVLDKVSQPLQVKPSQNHNVFYTRVHVKY